MEGWRHIVMFTDYVVFYRGLAMRGKAYQLTAERGRRLEELLGDTIAPALADQSWLWSWNDWNWNGIGEYDGDKRTASV